MKKQNSIKKPVSIKWKILGSLVFFIAIVIIVLWLFQVFFLESFYMSIKSSAVKKAASQINEIITSENDMEHIQTIAKENDFCIEIYENKEIEIGKLNQIYPNSQEELRCRIKNIQQNANNIIALQEKVAQSGEMASQMVNHTNQDKTWQPADLLLWNPVLQNGITTKPFIIQSRDFNNMIYISVLPVKYNTLKTVIIDAQLTPVNATIDTIKAQFLIITIILVLVAIGLALYLSKKIATPIIHINERAKLLATGKYDVEFKGKGYLEVEELSNTLNYAAHELSKVDNLRKELIANTSHDLRTPLTMIAGYGEVMRDIPGENTPENVQIIIDETNRLTALVNDMLDLSKLQAGAINIERMPFNITQEIERIISRYDKLLTSKDVEILFEHKEEVEVNGDIVKLGQVIYNLINNAINYCGEDHKVVVRQICDKQCVRIEFIDHGEGIEEDQLPYIWERYYKVDKTHIRSKVGSGLGLSIVKAVLELHEAEYGVNSKLHEGTIFWFSLPIYKEEVI